MSDWHGVQHRRHARRLRSGERRSSRSISSIRPARPARPRASCATRRHLVALNWTMRTIYDVESGRGVLGRSDVGWVVGHSYICYAPLITGATPRSSRAKPVGTPDAGTSGESSPITTCAAVSPPHRHPRRQDAKIRRRKLLQDYDISSLRRSFLAGERADPDTIDWARHLGVPVIDHWWQTETGWPLRQPRGIERCRSRPAPRPCRCPATTCRSLTTAAHPIAAGELGAIADQAAAAAGHLAHALERARTLPKRYLDTFPATTKPAMPAMSTRTATSTSWRAPMTSSTSPATACRPARWRKCWPAHPDVAECAVIGVRTI